MFSKKRREDSAIGTLIGTGTTVTGDLGFTGGLHLDGKIVGDVTGEAGAGAALTIGTAGIVEGSVVVDNLVLNGTVHGDVFARERVELGATASVDGNVAYKTLQMAEGARVNGRLVHEPEGLGVPAGRAAGDAPDTNSPGEEDGLSGLR